MTLELKTVRHIARLAHLKLTPEEDRLYLEQLGQILSHVETLQSLKTKNVPPTTHPGGLSAPQRPDTAHSTGPSQNLLENAPLREGQLFKVPKVL
ncbi:MAG: Asp-tRNA(Asn)/Glu-tRNA(Gln) amidotransferase subunit GatC [Elusimicrobia bacterium]|nr:Asp-tRNA(Asn)/Glu-tRNA(Gln) amidotransferase subunit GatC [Elusimicrobiota bacterium]